MTEEVTKFGLTAEEQHAAKERMAISILVDLARAVETGLEVTSAGQHENPNDPKRFLVTGRELLLGRNLHLHFPGKSIPPSVLSTALERAFQAVGIEDAVVTREDRRRHDEEHPVFDAHGHAVPRGNPTNPSPIVALQPEAVNALCDSVLREIPKPNSNIDISLIQRAHRDTETGKNFSAALKSALEVAKKASESGKGGGGRRQ